MNAARVYADLSHARRLKVGAVIVRDDRVVSIGYNGTPRGRDNNCEVLVENGIRYSLKKLKKSRVIDFDKLETKAEVVHAEMNAVLFAARNGVSTEGCNLYTTHSPCFECAKMIVQSGIVHLYYETDYRDLSSVDFLRECGIRVTKLKEST